MSRRPDAKQLTNRQRIARAEFLDKRIIEDKAEKKHLTELIVADLNTPKP